MMFCCDMSGPAAGDFGKSFSSDPVGKIGTPSVLYVPKAVSIIANVPKTEKTMEQMIAAGDKAGLVAYFIAQGNSEADAWKLAALALNKETSKWVDVPKPTTPAAPAKPSFTNIALPKVFKVDAASAALLQPPTNVQNIPGVKPPATTTTTTNYGGGGGGGGGGGSMWSFASPPEETPPPAAPPADTKLPGPEAKKSSALPLLAIAAAAFYALKG